MAIAASEIGTSRHVAVKSPRSPAPSCSSWCHPWRTRCQSVAALPCVFLVMRSPVPARPPSPARPGWCALHVGDDGPERTQEPRPDRPHLGPVRRGQPAEQRLAAGREADQHLPAVGGAAHPAHEPPLLHPIHQLHRAVVPHLQPLGERSHRRLDPIRDSLDREQQLMLLGLEARVARGLVAEPKEAPKLVAKIRERAIVGYGQPSGRHRAIISYHDVNANAPTPAIRVSGAAGVAAEAVDRFECRGVDVAAWHPAKKARCRGRSVPSPGHSSGTTGARATRSPSGTSTSRPTASTTPSATTS